MKKMINTILILIILIVVTIEILTDSESILNAVSFSFNIWKENVFPSLFPFFILSELLINYGFIELIGEICKPIMNKIFKTKGVGAFAFIMSLISGFPSSAKYIRELHKKELINEKEATKLLTFTHFSNPLFILGTISLLFLNNKEVGLLILICHYLGNIIIGIIFRNYYPTKDKTTKSSFKKVIREISEKRIKNKKSFGQVVTDALLNSINTLILILGVISMFLVITTIIDNNINLNSFNQSILNGFFEMTQGLKYVSLEAIPLKLKCTLSTMIISFGGLSVHMQIISILSDTKIKYFPFLTARILHAVISSLLIFFSFDIWMNLF
ncbi:MAG: hypothetical protein HFI87_04670 [Bacilli bacterium]|nr:hypothetical protein [Bacilli bacterium]